MGEIGMRRRDIGWKGNLIKEGGRKCGLRFMA